MLVLGRMQSSWLYRPTKRLAIIANIGRFDNLISVRCFCYPVICLVYELDKPSVVVMDYQ